MHKLFQTSLGPFRKLQICRIMGRQGHGRSEEYFLVIHYRGFRLPDYFLTRSKYVTLGQACNHPKTQHSYFMGYINHSLTTILIDHAIKRKNSFKGGPPPQPGVRPDNSVPPSFLIKVIALENALGLF